MQFESRRRARNLDFIYDIFRLMVEMCSITIDGFIFDMLDDRDDDGVGFIGEEVADLTISAKDL